MPFLSPWLPSLFIAALDSGGRTILESLLWFPHLFQRDIWRASEWPALTLLLCYLVWDLRKIFGLILTFSLQIMIAYSLFLVYFDYAGETQFNFHIRLAMAQALLWLLASSLVLIHAKPKLFDWMRIALMVFAAWNASLMVVHHFQGKTASGLIPSHTIASTFLACSFPFFLRELIPSPMGYLLCLLQILAIFFAGGSTGILCLIAVCVVYFERMKFTLISLVFLTPLFILMPKQDLLHFWDTSGRLPIWSEALRQWGEGTVFQKIFGFGTGSWEWLFNARYSRTGQMKDIWLFAHNDYFQVTYEQGLLGFLVLVTIIVNISQKLRTREMRACAVGYLIAMTTQSPMRIACLQILGICLVHTAMSKSKQDQ